MSVLVPPAHLLGSEVEVPCADGHAAPLRQPRLRGQHAGDGRRLGRRRGLRALVQQRPPRDRREVAGLDRGLRARARGRRALRRRARTAASSSSATRPRPINVLADRAAGGHARALDAGRAPREHAALAPARPARCCRSPTSADELLDASPSARCARTAIDLLAVTGASNVTGEVWPLAELAAARPRPRRRAVRRRRPARAAPRDRHGGRRDRPPRALRPQALRAVRRRRARQPRARSTATRCCTAAARSSSSRSTT